MFWNDSVSEDTLPLVLCEANKTFQNIYWVYSSHMLQFTISVFKETEVSDFDQLFISYQSLYVRSMVCQQLLHCKNTPPQNPPPFHFLGSKK